MLTIRINVQLSDSVQTILQRVRDTLIACSRCSDVPLTTIKKALSGHSSANFETTFTY